VVCRKRGGGEGTASSLEGQQEIICASYTEERGEGSRLSADVLLCWLANMLTTLLRLCFLV
jgi:hypothetical protein